MGKPLTISGGVRSKVGGILLPYHMACVWYECVIYMCCMLYVCVVCISICVWCIWLWCRVYVWCVHVCGIYGMWCVLWGVCMVVLCVCMCVCVWCVLGVCVCGARPCKWPCDMVSGHRRCCDPSHLWAAAEWLNMGSWERAVCSHGSMSAAQNGVELAPVW